MNLEKEKEILDKQIQDKHILEQMNLDKEKEVREKLGIEPMIEDPDDATKLSMAVLMFCQLYNQQGEQLKLIATLADKMGGKPLKLVQLDNGMQFIVEGEPIGEENNIVPMTQ